MVTVDDDSNNRHTSFSVISISGEVKVHFPA